MSEEEFCCQMQLYNESVQAGQFRVQSCCFQMLCLADQLLVICFFVILFSLMLVALLFDACKMILAQGKS